MTESKGFHTPVMVGEVLEGLKVREGGKYIDCTLGGGGHGVAILEREGILLGIDQDMEAIEFTRRKMENGGWKVGENVYLERANFSQINEVARKYNFGQIDGILYDLGMSSYQLDQSGRGFSFQKEEPLDMRMDQTLGVTAADLVNSLSERELTKIFKQFGQEKHSRAMAKAIVRARNISPIRTTRRLVDVVLKVAPGSKSRIHPATNVFQALRLVVNSELHNLEVSLSRADPLLKAGGRLVIISFHSLEDRIAKRLKDRPSLKAINKRPLRPSEQEVTGNPRSRSARLRVYEKL